MSYTTQKEFFNVPFHNEAPKLPERKRSDGALMTYDLCTDGRAWALDKQKRSNYILDVVHKTRFKKAMLHPEGQFELSKDYLIHLDVEDLADYILSLQAEVKRKNESVQQLEEARRSMGEELDAIQMKSDELNVIQQRSAMLAEERNDFEQQMEQLEMVIVDLKDRADRYDLLANENKLLRDQLKHQRMEAADRIRLINAEVEANFNRMRAEDCEKLEAELAMFKAQYEDMRQQKRGLKEQLQTALMKQSKMMDLKRQLALEQVHREKVEDELEHLLSLYDQQFQTLGEKSLPAITGMNEQSAERWVDSRVLSSAIEPVVSASENVMKKCENCKNIEMELENRRRIQKEELEVRESQSKALQEQVNLLKKEMDLTASAMKDEDKSRKLTADFKNYQDEIEMLRKSEREAQQKLLDVEQTLKQTEAKLVEESRKKETLETAALKESTQNADDSTAKEMIRLQEMLKNAQTELDKKSKDFEELTQDNKRLQAEAVTRNEEIEKLQEIQRQQSAQIEVSNIEQAQKSEQMIVSGGAEIDSLKKVNDDLQKEIARLLEAQSMTQADASKAAESEAGLRATIDNLLLELQDAKARAEHNEETIRKMEVEVEMARSSQQLAEPEPAVIDARETELLNEKIRELEEKLKECETTKNQLRRETTTNEADQDENQAELDVSSQKIFETKSDILEILGSAELMTNAEESVHENGDDEEVRSSASQETIIAEEAEKQRSSVKLEKDDEAGVEADGRRSADRITIEDEDDIGEEDIDDVGVAESLPTKDSNEDTERRASQEQKTRPESNGFMDGDIISIGTSDPDKTRLIAIKIVRHGIDILVIAELDHLHREICRAIIERYLKLGQNVKAIDQAMYECHHILDSVKKMGNNEMNCMLGNPSTQVPMVNHLLLEDEIPDKLPAKSKQRSKSTSFSQGSRSLNNAGRVLVGEYDERYGGDKWSSKKQGKAITENSDQCRTRPWRAAPKTPTETMVASTLADGSRIVVRQKRNL
ncbi:putative uncharacterized protein MYH16 [Armigeres subalbatus]|uniref:putative uncharacterized protein MYH16 n=1 Tax=Armigeres subalbatus TaxID=124917 RepID=UPI002ED43257